MADQVVFDSAREGLNDAMKNDVHVTMVGGDMGMVPQVFFQWSALTEVDAVTNWISLFRIAFGIKNLGDFIDAKFVAFDDESTKGEFYPKRPTQLGDANLKDRVWVKSGSKLRYIMIKNAGHDLEKQGERILCPRKVNMCLTS